MTPSNVLIALALSLFLGGAMWLGINGSNTLGIRPVMAPSTPVTIVDDQSGEGVQPVEPKQNVEDGRDGRPDFWAKDIDHELLRYKPLPIRWADPVHKDCDLTFDPEKRRLVVQVFSSAIFELAEVNEPNFDYHVQINSSSWKTTRNSGIAFGIKRTNNVNDTVFAQVNLIVGNYLPPDFNNNRPNAAWFLNRMSGVVKTKLDFAGFHDWGSTMTFCNTDIPSPIANGMKIKISVRNRLLTSVQYNGQVFDGFLNLKNEERLLNPDATGGIGVVTFGNAIFTNAILRVLK